MYSDYSSASVFTTQFIVTDDIAAVELEMYFDNEHYVTTGISRRHPQDKPDQVVAKQLAMSRALESLSRKLARKANGKVKHNDQLLNLKQAAKSYAKDCSCPNCENYRKHKNVQ